MGWKPSHIPTDPIRVLKKADPAVIEFSERLSYFGLATNLIIYLTKVLHQDVKTAAKNVNYWIGVTTMMPLLGGFVADAYLGRFSTILVSTLIYLLVIICVIAL